MTSVKTNTKTGYSFKIRFLISRGWKLLWFKMKTIKYLRTLYHSKSITLSNLTINSLLISKSTKENTFSKTQPIYLSRSSFQSSKALNRKICSFAESSFSPKFSKWKNTKSRSTFQITPSLNTLSPKEVFKPV